MLQFHEKNCIAWFSQEKWQKMEVNKNPENWQCVIVQGSAVQALQVAEQFRAIV